MSEVEEIKSKLVCLRQACEYLGMSYRTALRRVKEGDFPEPIEWSDNIRLWLKSDIMDYRNKKGATFRKRGRSSHQGDLDVIRAMLEDRGAL